MSSALLLLHFIPWQVIISLRKCLKGNEIFNNVFKEMELSEPVRAGAVEGELPDRRCSSKLEMRPL